MQALVDDSLINYEILNPDGKETVVFLHGWKRSLDDWKTIAESLASNFKIVLIDLPGMGLSSLPTNTINTEGYADILIKFFNKINLKNIILVGHSFGGKIATIITTKESVEKLILVDASGINNKSFAIKTKITLSKILKPLSFLPIDFSSSDYKSAGPLLNIFKKVVNEDVENYAKKIKIPALIIWGDKDKEVTTLHAKKFKKLIPNSKLRIVWNTGHDPFIEKPNKFLEIIYEFI